MQFHVVDQLPVLTVFPLSGKDIFCRGKNPTSHDFRVYERFRRSVHGMSHVKFVSCGGICPSVQSTKHIHALWVWVLRISAVLLQVSTGTDVLVKCSK